MRIRLLTCVVPMSSYIISHPCSSLLAHPDTRVKSFHKGGGFQQRYSLREKLPIGADTLSFQSLEHGVSSFTAELPVDLEPAETLSPNKDMVMFRETGGEAKLH